MISLPEAFRPMAAYRQWLCFVATPDAARPGKTTKLPVSPYTGKVCDAQDPAHWCDAEAATRAARRFGAGYGVAFSFQTSDPFFFLDIDNAWDGSEWSPVARDLCARFAGAAIEVSQSGKGLHIFGVGDCPPHGSRNTALGLELYTERRFVALTGINAAGDAGSNHTGALASLVAEYFPSSGVAGAPLSCGWSLSTEPVPEWRGPTDDADLLRRALASKSVASTFGASASFADLWGGNVDALARAYPDGARAYDASQADAALIAHLAFWTGRHGERMERLMWQSALARDKWERDDYLPRSIAAVLAHPSAVLQDKPLAEPAGAVVAPGVSQAEQRAVDGQTFLSPAMQLELFRGCVYVLDRHRALVPGGHLLKPDQFRARYGGYTFAMDTVNERTSRNAWEAFTESQALRAPHADSVCFRPDLEPGAIVEASGRQLVNTYWPAAVARVKGDAGPFLRHLAKVLPDARDQAILLNYMAACVQYKGVKFPWAPVLQGCEGNGKTLFSACVAEAVGQQFTHWPDARDLGSQFNGWLADRVFIAVEELFSSDHQVEIVDVLKTIITGNVKQIQFKGVDQTSMSICCNVIITTNYKGVIRKTPDNARRFALFYTAQQSAADLARDGMGGDYFPRLYDWLKKEGGFAIVTDLLLSHAIDPEFNPAGSMHRAPDTSTTDLAIIESRGGVEQAIAEVVAQGTPGFMGGWISSVMLDRLLTDTLRVGGRLTHAKRRELLQGMGYVLHPGLPEGRTNNAVLPDAKKPQLWLLKGHPALSLTGAAEIARAYSADQVV